MYESFSALVPQSFLAELKRQLDYNGIRVNERRFAGFMVAFGPALAFTITFLSAFYIEEEAQVAAVFVVALAGFFFLAYSLLKLGSESKGKFVEGILPDALQLIASNMKSGLTTERALFVAGRPEFGPLQLELRNASKRISIGERVETALFGISERINSAVLGKTIWLISEGIKRGGQISDLLFQIAKDLKNEQEIEEEIKANVSIYVLLILFASIVGGPLLFGVSSTIVQVISKQVSATPKVASTAVAQTGIGVAQGFATGERAIPSPEFISLFSVVTIMAGSFIAAITIGIINTGKETNGLKHAAPIVVLSLLVYFGVKAVMQGLFGHII